MLSVCFRAMLPCFVWFPALFNWFVCLFVLEAYWREVGDRSSIQYVAHASDSNDPAASTSQVLRLQTCTTTSSFQQLQVTELCCYMRQEKKNWQLVFSHSWQGFKSQVPIQHSCQRPQWLWLRSQFLNSRLHLLLFNTQTWSVGCTVVIKWSKWSFKFPHLSGLNCRIAEGILCIHHPSI